MEDLIRISMLCITVVLIINVINEGSRVMSAVITVAAARYVIYFTVSKAAFMFGRIETIISVSGIDHDLLDPVIKVAGISICGRMSAELCRDLGSRWAAGNIELLAVILSVVSMSPLIEKVLDIIGSI